MLKIVISGYYGFDNAGDEAVLLSIIQALRLEALPGESLDITVLSKNPQATSERYGVKAVNRWRMPEVFKALRQADVLISGGGSLLQDVTSKKSVLYYLTVIGMAVSLRRPVVFYSQGVGPVNDAFNRKLMGLVCNRVSEIYVRDVASKDALVQMGIKRPAIQVVMDPVVSMALTEAEWKKGESLLIEANITGDRPLAGMYLRDWKTDSNYHAEVAKVCEWLYNQGWLPVFIPMHYPDDVQAVEAIKPLLKTPAKFLEAHYSPQEILAMTAKMDFVVAMRLHGLIMAANAKTPYFGISYDPKIQAFIASSGFGQVMDVKGFSAERCIFQLKDFTSDLNAHRETLVRLKPQFDQKTRQPARAVMGFARKRAKREKN